jgi:hypothetical protein
MNVQQAGQVCLAFFSCAYRYVGPVPEKTKEFGKIAFS